MLFYSYQSQKDDVKHEGNVNRPVDAVAIEVKAVDHLEYKKNIIS